MTEPTAEQTEHDGPDPIERRGAVYVGLKLAHPLSEEQAARLRPLSVKAYTVGNTIRVTREFGEALIGAGYAQVDPENRQAVRAALFLNQRDQPLTMAEIAEARADAAAAAAERAAEAAEARATAAAEAAERIAAAEKRRAEAEAKIAAVTEAPQDEKAAAKAKSGS